MKTLRSVVQPEVMDITKCCFSSLEMLCLYIYFETVSVRLFVCCCKPNFRL